MGILSTSMPTSGLIFNPVAVVVQAQFDQQIGRKIGRLLELLLQGPALRGGKRQLYYCYISFTKASKNSNSYQPNVVLYPLSCRGVGI